MSAVAACSWASAARISGRRRASSEGCRPACAAAPAGPVLGGRARRAARRAADLAASSRRLYTAFPAAPAPAPARGYFRPAPPRSRHRRRRLPLDGALLRAHQDVLGDLQIVDSDPDLHLDAAHLDVVARQFREARDEGIAALLGGLIDLRIGRFNLAADAAPEVKLPGSVEADVVFVERYWNYRKRGLPEAWRRRLIALPMGPKGPLG